MKILNFSKANCKNCYKCLRSCPVKAIKIKDGQAEIVSDKCIGCGNCFNICPQNARKIKSDIEKIKEAIQSNKRVIASIAPSYIGAFYKNSVGQLVEALINIGFSQVEETAIGAELVSRLYKEYMEKKDYKAYITTCCSSVNDLIEKYYPKLVKYMIPVVSPMVAHGISIKKRYEEDVYVVFIGPCISKKIEAVDFRNEGKIDAVITFEELQHWFDEENIKLNELKECDLIEKSFKRGRAFPIEKILEDIDIPYDYDIIKVSGIEDSIEILELLNENQLKNVCVEISTCRGSCMKGPAMIHNNYYKAKKLVADYADEGYELNNNNNIYHENFEKKFINRSLLNKKASESEIKDILKKIGKYHSHDELNCGGCGYNTCREKAQAVHEGMAELNMCLPFMKSKAENLTSVIFEHSPNGIIVLTQDLKVKMINHIAEIIFKVKNHEIKNQSIDSILDADLFHRVLRTKENIIGKKVYYKLYDIVLLQSIIYLKKENLFLLIMTNVTDEENHKKELALVKENTIDAAQKVIEKQMRVAQEIASLLGETTAETKGILTKLKKIVLQENGEYK